MIRLYWMFFVLVTVSAQSRDFYPLLPETFSSSLMWNIKIQEVEKNQSSFTFSMWETVEPKKLRSMIEIIKERNVDEDDGSVTYFLEQEKLVWKPMSGVNEYLYLWTGMQENQRTDECFADSTRGDSFINFLFGFDPSSGSGYPSVANMLHWGPDIYTFEKETVVNGIEVLEYRGRWNITAWQANFDVSFYWSNPSKWEADTGNVSVPVSIKVQGVAGIFGSTADVQMVIDYAEFYEVSVPDSKYQLPPDVWCSGRTMPDSLPQLTSNHFTFDSEIVVSFQIDEKTINLITPRTEWYDNEFQVSRVDFKAADLTRPGEDPFAGNNGFISQIHDYNTGLQYSIDQTFGNCSIQYMTESNDGVDENGILHMRNPMAMFFEDRRFAYNGLYYQRGFQVDSYLNTMPNYQGGENYTTVLMLTSTLWEIDNQVEQQRMLPAKLIRYPTAKYNNPVNTRVTENFYNFRTHRPDFQSYDITPCFNEDHKLHLMIRLGWTMDMDIENTIREFYVETRQSIVIWGEITPIRVQNIEVFIDADNSAFFVIFTIVDFPPGFDYELNEFPNAIRPLDEVKKNLKKAIDKKWFKISVYRNDGSGHRITALAEPGSLKEIGDRSGDYNYKDGYGSGSMWALGVCMLLIAVVGSVVLLVYVLKF